MATLAEISAQHNERLAAIERSNQRLEQTVQAIGELTANVQRRVPRLEESYVTVVELLRNHHEGFTEMRAAQANADAKIAALANAQIRGEETMNVLKAAQADADAKIAALAVSQANSDRKLDALIDIVRGGRNGESDG